MLLPFKYYFKYGTSYLFSCYVIASNAATLYTASDILYTNRREKKNLNHKSNYFF